MCFEQKKRKENFTLCMDICNITGKNCSNILKHVFQKVKRIIHINKEKRKDARSQCPQLYLSANQLHLSVIYSHHQAEHVAGLHTDKVVFRL
jgi:hypothetical protein